MIDLVQGFAKAIFGDKGMAGTIIGALKDAGILKDPEHELAVLKVLNEYDLKVREFEAQLVAAVNTTMQAEAKSEHWLQWSWRPIFGLTGAAILINNYILLPYFGKLGIIPIAVPTEVWLMIMAVLGVAAWTRGQEKISKINQRNGK